MRVGLELDRRERLVGRACKNLAAALFSWIRRGQPQVEHKPDAPAALAARFVRKLAFGGSKRVGGATASRRRKPRRRAA